MRRPFAFGAAAVGFSNTLALVLAQHPLTGFLAVAKSSPVHSAKDLNNKLIAATSLSSTQYYALRNWIDLNGGDSKTVRFVEVSIPLAAESILSLSGMGRSRRRFVPTT